MNISANDRVVIGGNSAAYGQMLKPVLPAAPKAPKQRFPYFKFYPRDWIEATRDMTLEARGAYIDLICILMEMEGHLADNDSWISHQMHVSTRKWKSVKKQLVEHEKIRIEDGKIVNERCLKELDSLLAHRRTIADSAVSRERAKRENREKSNENNDTNITVVPLRALASDSDLDKKDIDVGSARDARSLTKAVALGFAAATIALPAAAAMPPEPVAITQPASTFHALADKLHDAGGRALNLTNPGLHVVEMPRNWMAAGCDLELDILPIIRAMTAQKAPNSVSAWKYFERAIMDAKAARSASLVEGQPPPGKFQQRLAPWEEEKLRIANEAREVLARMGAQYKQEMERGNG